MMPRHGVLLAVVLTTIPMLHALECVTAQPASFPDGVVQVRVASDGLHLYLLQMAEAELDGKVLVWDLDRCEVQRVLDLPAGIGSMAVREGRLVLTSWVGHRVLILDEQDLHVIHDLAPEDSGSPLQPAWASQASPPGTVIVSCRGTDTGGATILVNLETGECDGLARLERLRWWRAGGMLLGAWSVEPEQILFALGMGLSSVNLAHDIHRLQDLASSSIQPEWRPSCYAPRTPVPNHLMAGMGITWQAVHGGTALLTQGGGGTALTSADLRRWYWVRTDLLVASHPRVPLAVVRPATPKGWEPRPRSRSPTILLGLHTATGDVLWRRGVHFPDEPRSDPTKLWAEARFIPGPQTSILIVGLPPQPTRPGTRITRGAWYRVELPGTQELEPLPLLPPTALPRRITAGTEIIVELCRGVDLEGAWVFSLLDGPRGVKVDPERGTVRWTPTRTQLGSWQIHVGMQADGVTYPILHGLITVETSE
jgi:hypothetical protein